MKTVWSFLRKLNIELLYDPANSLLSISPKELETGTQTGTGTPKLLQQYSQEPKGGNNVSVYQQCTFC